MSVERSTTATPTGLLFAFIALNFPSSNAHCASVRFEFDVCAYANSLMVQFKYSWSLGDQVSILVRSSGEWFVIRNYHISTQCFMHSHIPVSLRGVHQKRQPPPDVEKMVENGESAATLTANAMALASLRDFILFKIFSLRSPICISLAFINCLFCVTFLPAMKGFRVCFSKWKITVDRPTVDEIRVARSASTAARLFSSVSVKFEFDVFDEEFVQW